MSGRKFSFEINQTSTAPAATVFRLETDGANWSSGPSRSSSIELGAPG